MVPPAGRPTVRCMRRHRSLLSLIVVVLLVAGSAAGGTAATSLAQEVAAGQALSARLEAGQIGCADLSNDDFDHLGEYVMNRMVGSLARHEALNARMTSMMGADNEARMHVLMGQRYAGCLATGTTTGGWMGPGMMGSDGWNGGGPWSQMMGSGMWSWMSDGHWQQMSSGDWQRLGAQWMGPGMMTTGGDRWSAADTGLVVGGALILAAAIGGLLAWRGSRGTPSS